MKDGLFDMSLDLRFAALSKFDEKIFYLKELGSYWPNTTFESF